MIGQVDPSTDKIKLIRLNDGTREIYAGDCVVKLTKKEFAILQVFVSFPGRLFKRDDLLGQVWGPDVHVAGRTLDAHIVKLRRKMRRLGEHAPTIETVWALGYRLRG